MSQFLKPIQQAISKVIIGKDKLVEQLYLSLLSGGHLLMMDVPGIGKTTLAKAFAKVCGFKFGRIQGSPDLMPGDIAGVHIFNPEGHQFKFFEGPLFSNILLFDEINRTNPKTQSALLEGMAEKTVTLDGKNYLLPSPFLVIATANPLESAGTFDLPDSQLDRFLIRTTLGYPTEAQEKSFYRGEAGDQFLDSLKPLFTLEEWGEELKNFQKVHFADKLTDYVFKITEASRNHPDIALGISPRGAKNWIIASKAIAFFRGRDFVTPDDLQELSLPILSHRLIPQLSSFIDQEIQAQLLHQIMRKVEVPL